MENRNTNEPIKNDNLILISKSRIITLSMIMIVFGAFGVVLGFLTIANSRKFEIPAMIFAVLAILGGLYAIYFAIKCLCSSRVQLQFKKDGISYRDVRKHVIGRNIDGITLGFYSNTKFYFLPYAVIEKVSLKKFAFGCSLIQIDTKQNEVIYLPILLDSCKEVDELAHLIDKKRQ